MSNDKFNEYIKGYLLRGAQVRMSLPIETTLACARLIYTTIINGQKLILCGNGGSAADCQHIAAEFVNRFKIDRKPLPALALTTDTSILTSIGNDFGFDQIFSKQILAFGNPDDVLLAFTTSGSSSNIDKALDAAKLKNMKIILLSSQKAPQRIRHYPDHGIYVASDETPIIQEMHITIGHIICDIVDIIGQSNGLFG